MGNDIIDCNDLNDGIVYIEGGIGKSQQRRSPTNSHMKQQ